MGARGGLLVSATGHAATWPPMLLASYRGLLECDASSPGIIADDSPAEHLASRLLHSRFLDCIRSDGPCSERDSDFPLRAPLKTLKKIT